MTSPLIHRSLSAASRTLLQFCWRPSLYGHVTRCLSAKASSVTSVTGPNCINYKSGRHQQIAVPVLEASPLSLTTDKNDTVGKRKAELILQKWAVRDSEIALEQSLTRLTLSPLEARLSVDVMLPRINTPVGAKVIQDPHPLTSLLRDCPTLSPLMPLQDPLSNLYPKEIHLPVQGNTAKHAASILKKRRRKMNRHQYLKWKKRNKFKLRIQRQRSKKKKRLKWEKHLDQFRFKGLRLGEGEEYLAKKREKLAIFLRYLGIKTDEEEAAEKMKMGGQVRRTGKIIPEPMLPPGAKMGSKN